MIFRNENSVRQWAKKRWKNVFWVEHGRGGTVGLPDCFRVDSGVVLWYELKIGVRDGQWLKYEVRREQRSTLGRMRQQLGENKRTVMLLVGEKGTGKIWLLSTNENALTGRVDTAQHGVLLDGA